VALGGSDWFSFFLHQKAKKQGKQGPDTVKNFISGSGLNATLVGGLSKRCPLSLGGFCAHMDIKDVAQLEEFNSFIFSPAPGLHLFDYM
jgi:hypothetical protein